MSKRYSDTGLPVRQSRLAPLVKPIQAFLEAESAGGIMMLLSALSALVWANSAWGESYLLLWHTSLSLSVADFGFAMSLEHWVNDGLMVIFFLLVGLEIKREMVIGELSSLRQASLPIAAAIGGMVVPAAIFLLFNRGGPGAQGWGVPMATDIAFAVGVLAIAGRRLPIAVKVFLLAVAIVDDLGAVLVIAIFYTSSISMPAVIVAMSFLAVLILINLLGVHRPLPYVLLGLGLWAATLASGIHATIAGVLLAFTIPATRQIEEQPYVNYVREMLQRFERDAQLQPDQITDDQSYALMAMEEASEGVQTPLARVEHALLKPVNFLIVPLFALANAGVDLKSAGASAISSPLLWGVTLGLVVGKPVGILLASWLAIKSGIASFPESATWRQISGVSVLCGIGFTMSLFVAQLAFVGQDQTLAVTKLGILIASAVAGIAGGGLIAWASPHQPAMMDNRT